jgi:hypothetical protein
VTPVMDRCACPAAYPIAECVTCTPTPDGGLYPDHRQPIPPPTPRAPADDTDGLAQPISAGYVLGGWAALGLMAWGVVGLAAWGLWEISSAIVRALS